MVVTSAGFPTLSTRYRGRRPRWRRCRSSSSMHHRLGLRRMPCGMDGGCGCGCGTLPTWALRGCSGTRGNSSVPPTAAGLHDCQPAMHNRSITDVVQHNNRGTSWGRGNERAMREWADADKFSAAADSAGPCRDVVLSTKECKPVATIIVLISAVPYPHYLIVL